MSSGASELTYPLGHESGSGNYFHSYTCVNDAAGIGQKCWNFQTNGGVTDPASCRIS